MEVKMCPRKMCRLKVLLMTVTLILKMQVKGVQF